MSEEKKQNLKEYEKNYRKAKKVRPKPTYIFFHCIKNGKRIGLQSQE